MKRRKELCHSNINATALLQNTFISKAENASLHPMLLQDTNPLSVTHGKRSLFCRKHLHEEWTADSEDSDSDNNHPLMSACRAGTKRAHRDEDLWFNVNLHRIKENNPQKTTLCWNGSNASTQVMTDEGGEELGRDM